MMENKDETIKRIREFNRFYTPLIGILDRNYLDSGYSVTENRILFELYEHKNLTAKYLCDLLLLNKGYISRLLAGFEKKDLIMRAPSGSDGRSQNISLTSRGEMEARRVIGITNNKIGSLIENIDEADCKEIRDAMQCIEEKLSYKHCGKSEWEMNENDRNYSCTEK